MILGFYNLKQVHIYPWGRMEKGCSPHTVHTMCTAPLFWTLDDTQTEIRIAFSVPLAAWVPLQGGPGLKLPWGT